MVTTVNETKKVNFILKILFFWREIVRICDSVGERRVVRGVCDGKYG
jgi:hypothetical protein